MKERGQMLIEFLIALGAGVAILSAIGVAVVSALNNAQFSKNQNLANQYANQGMEIIRRLRSSDWTVFSSYDGKYCLDKNKTALVEKDQSRAGCSGLSQNMPQNVDNFAREVDIEKNSSDCTISPVLASTKVTVAVSWFDSKCPAGPNLFCHTINLVSCFTRREAIQAP